MTELESMYAAVKSSPQEATLRLAYADCLDEHNRHVDAAHQRILATPESDELRLAFADECEIEADRIRDNDAPVMPESTLIGQQSILARVWPEFVRVQVALAKCTVKQRPHKPSVYGPRDREAWMQYNERAREFRKFEALSLREREILGEHAMKLTCLNDDEFIFTNVGYNVYRIETTETVMGYWVGEGSVVDHNTSQQECNRHWTMRVSTHRGFVDNIQTNDVFWDRFHTDMLEIHPITKIHMTNFHAGDRVEEFRQRWPRIKFTF